MKVTIGVKTLNEERNIGRTLENALQAIAPYGGEVILADSGSSDRTIEIARGFPVTIVQLENHAERCCGAGAQLAFQYVNNEFFYLLDGDMILNGDFIPTAVALLESNPEVAGVGGRVREMNTESPEFQIRAEAVARTGYHPSGFVDRLDGGGLYRVSAIRDVEYFADRNLHAFEEFELGSRLLAKGWKLVSIDFHAVDHFGHQLKGYGLLWRRFRSGYSGGAGEVLRGALGEPHFGFVLRRLNHIRQSAIVMIWWLALFVSLLAPIQFSYKILLLITLLAGPIIFLSWRRRSLKLGLYSAFSWNVGALAFINGFFRKRVAPQKPLAAVVVARGKIEPRNHSSAPRSRSMQ